MLDNFDTNEEEAWDNWNVDVLRILENILVRTSCKRRGSKKNRNDEEIGAIN